MSTKLASLALVKGYIKEFEKKLDNLVIPSSIMDLCFIFYFYQQNIIIYMEGYQIFIAELKDNKANQISIVEVMNDPTPFELDTPFEIKNCNGLCYKQNFTELQKFNLSQNILSKFDVFDVIFQCSIDCNAVLFSSSINDDADNLGIFTFSDNKICTSNIYP